MKVVGVTKICAFAELNRLTSTLKALPRTTPIRRALPFRGLTNAELRATSLFCFSHLSHGQEYKPEKKPKNILVRKGRSGAVVVELVTWQVASRRAALLTRTHYCSLVVRLSESSLASRELLLLLLFF